MTTYVQLRSQIQELERQAEKTRKEEFSAVVKAIKKQITDYGITANDLGLYAGRSPGADGKTKRSKSKTGSKITVKRVKSRTKVLPKYRDEAGNTWTGRGKQPRWVVAAVAAGRDLESMLIRQV